MWSAFIKLKFLLTNKKEISERKLKENVYVSYNIVKLGNKICVVCCISNGGYFLTTQYIFQF